MKWLTVLDQFKTVLPRHPRFLHTPIRSIPAALAGCGEASQSQGQGISVVRPKTPPLRAMGYIFWDQDRLQEAGILDRPKDEMEPIPWPNAGYGRLTVEERLEGVPLRNSALEEQFSHRKTPEIMGDYEY